MCACVGMYVLICRSVRLRVLTTVHVACLLLGTREGWCRLIWTCCSIWINMKSAARQWAGLQGSGQTTLNRPTHAPAHCLPLSMTVPLDTVLSYYSDYNECSFCFSDLTKTWSPSVFSTSVNSMDSTGSGVKVLRAAINEQRYGRPGNPPDRRLERALGRHCTSTNKRSHPKRLTSWDLG